MSFSRLALASRGCSALAGDGSLAPVAGKAAQAEAASGGCRQGVRERDLVRELQRICCNSSSISAGRNDEILRARKAPFSNQTVFEPRRFSDRSEAALQRCLLRLARGRSYC